MRIPPALPIALVLAGVLACEGKPSSTGTDTLDPSSSSDDSGTSTSPGGSSTTAPLTTGGMLTTGATTVESGTTADTPDTTTPFETDGTTGITAGETTNAVTGDHTTGDTGSGTDPGGTTEGPEPTCEGSDPTPLAVPMLAYTDGQIDPGSEDPTLLHLRFSSHQFTCADPHAWLPCGGNWDLSIRIPEALQTPGLHALWLDSEVMAVGSEQTGSPGQMECDGGGGVVHGTLEITAIDDKTVTGRLCNVTWHGLDNDFKLDGSFVATRCPE